MARAKKRKKFFDVELPILEKETQLYGESREELEGRTIKYDVTRILKGKNTLLHLETKIQGEKVTGIPKRLELMKYYLRKMLRKNSDYVEDSIKLKCRNAEITIKPFMISRRRISRAVRNDLRKKAREEIELYVREKESDDIFDDVLKNRLQKPLSSRLKKIYPLSLCEIRVLETGKPLKNEANGEER